MSDGREAKEGERPPSPKPQVAVPTTATEEQKRKKMTENAEKLCREVDSVAQVRWHSARGPLLIPLMTFGHLPPVELARGH